MSKFAVDGTEYDFVESPTFGEARAIEKVTGVAFSALGASENQSVDLMQALVWISMRRVNPDLTFDDLDDIDMAILNGLPTPDESADPTEPEAAETTSEVSA